MKYCLLATIGFFSLLIGSFITMLVYRLPLILQRQWQKEHQQFLSKEESNDLERVFIKLCH
jgi:leader peptidase (prepilin peptidase)/N-methyltransferase